MTNPTNPAWLDLVRILPTTDEIQAAESALNATDTTAQHGAAETALLGAMLSVIADELE